MCLKKLSRDIKYYLKIIKLNIFLNGDFHLFIIKSLLCFPVFTHWLLLAHLHNSLPSNPLPSPPYCLYPWVTHICIQSIWLITSHLLTLSYLFWRVILRPLHLWLSTMIDFPDQGKVSDFKLTEPSNELLIFSSFLDQSASRKVYPELGSRAQNESAWTGGRVIP